MPQRIVIPKEQKERLIRLEELLVRAATDGDLGKAKAALNDLSPILRKYNHHYRIAENKLKLYEIILENWDLKLAKRGLLVLVNEVNRETRLFLEATALLAIAYLREGDLESAQPRIATVLRDDEVIASTEKRREFRAEIIERFDQEGALAALAEVYPEYKSETELHREAVDLLRSGRDEEDLLEGMGASTPQSVKDFILRIDEMSKKMLPDADRLMLPSPREIVVNRQAGRVVYSGLKRRLYLRICDKESDLYQAWIENGLAAVLDNQTLATIVYSLFQDLKIGTSALAVYFTARVMKKGIFNFCTNNKPVSIMNMRG